MRLRGSLMLIIIVAFALLSMVGQILGLYTDWLWFREVQFTSVFLTVLRTQVILGVVTGAAFFLILYLNVLLAWRLSPRDAIVLADDALAKSTDPEELRTLLLGGNRPAARH